jgi:hypothetical protein
MAKRLALIVAMLFIPALAKADEITYTYTGPASLLLLGAGITALA